MIRIDLLVSLAALCSFFCFVFFLFWHSGEGRKRRGEFLDPKFIWHCSVCTYSYVNTKDERICVCPRCGSYNKK